MEARLKQELDALPTKRREESWSVFWQRAFDERTCQLVAAHETIATLRADATKAAEERKELQRILGHNPASARGFLTTAQAIIDSRNEAVKELARVRETMTRTVAATIERAATAESELARERERHQDLRGIVEEYRESHINSRRPCSNEGLGGPDSRCSTCKQADALLEPAPVATGEK